MEGVQIRVSDLIYAIKKRWKLILLITIIGFAIGGMITAASYLQGTMSKNYEVNASAVFLTEGVDKTFTNNEKSPNINDIKMAADMIETVRYITKSDTLLNGVIEDLNLLGITAKDISDNLNVKNYEETPILEYSLSWRSSNEGVNILEKLIEKSSQILKDTLKVGTMSMIDAPTAKYIIGGSINAPMWGIMGVLGFLLGIGIVALDLLLHPTLINIKDVTSDFNIETLGIIREDKEYFEKDIKLLSRDSSSGIMQDYSATSYILKNKLGKEKDTTVFYITSTAKGEGKTSAAANIAVQFSDMEKKVLLVDFNTRNPGLGPLFIDNIVYEHSLNALYRGDINEHEAVTTLTGYLDILPVVLERNPIPLDSTIFELIRNISSKYEYVIMDAPAVEESSSTFSLNQIADAAVLVIGFDMCTKQDISAAIDTMNKSGVKLLGCIVNKERAIDSFSLLSRDETPKEDKKKVRSKEDDVSSIDDMMNDIKNTEQEEKAPNNIPVDRENRNIMEEIFMMPKETELSDEDAAHALVKMGMESSEKTESKSDNSEDTVIDTSEDKKKEDSSSEANKKEL